MFSKVKEEIFKAMLADGYSVFVESFILASIYSKRRWRNGISLPDETFIKLVQESDVKSGWKPKMETNGIKVHKKRLPGSNICYREECVVNAPLQMMVDMVFLKRAEYDKGTLSIEVLERINTETVILHIKLKNFVPLAKNRDAVVLMCTKRTNSSVMILLGSCDHENAPETDECLRSKVSLAGGILTPLSSTFTRYVGVVQVVDTGKLPGTAKQGRVMANRSANRVKAMVEYAEKIFAESKSVY